MRERLLTRFIRSFSDFQFLSFVSFTKIQGKPPCKKVIFLYMTQKISDKFSIGKFLNFSLLLILTAAVLTSLSLSCQKNPFNLGDDDDDREVINLDSLARANDFIPISTFHELCRIGKDKDLPLDTNYMLIKNINVSKNDWRLFDPIGTRINPFTGVFDGYGHTVKKVHIRRVDSTDVGFFGFTEGAVIKRLHIEADSILGGTNVVAAETNVGGIVGMARNTIIDSCSFSGRVIGKQWVGGIVGTAFGTGITRSISEGIVRSDGVGGAAGGLVGSLTDGSIVSLSFSKTDVVGTGFHNTGGLVGDNYISEIDRSYSIGSVSGGIGFTGGLLGHVHDGHIWHSYSTGKVNWKEPGEAGGLIGRVSRNSTVTGSYWDTLTSRISISMGTVLVDTAIIVGGELRDTTLIVNGEPVDTTIIVGGELRDTTIVLRGEVGLDTQRMMQKRTYAGWDFNTIWNIEEGKSTPYFMWHE